MAFLRVLCPIAVACMLCAPAGFGQSTSAQITGQVSDQSGGVVPGASITVLNNATGIKRETESNSTGNYSIPLLQPGTYRITAQKEGFKPVSRSGIVLQVDQVARIDFVLDVGAVTETVEVQADAPLLQQETSALGQVVDNQKILNLPLNGRMTFRLVQLTPGVLTTSGANGQFGDVSVGTFDDINFSINGARAQSNEVMVDGVPATTGFFGLFTTIPSVDATQEFKVQSNSMSAEWGRFGGGVINVSTRGGSNELHGTLFHFLRNSALDANEFFNNRAGRSKPPFRMNQFGAAVGGPVIRSKTFFFADYEGTRWRRGDVFLTSVPTAEQRAGDFSKTLTNTGQLIVIYDPATTRTNPAQAGQPLRDPFPGNVLPSGRMDPVARNMIRYYPNPNTTGDQFTLLNNFLSNASRKIDKDGGSGRLDHNLTDSQRLFGRFAFTRNLLNQPDHFANEATPGVGANGSILFKYYTAALDYSATVNPSTIFNLRYGFARFYWFRATRSFGFDQKSLGFPDYVTANAQIPVFPAITVEGYSAMSGGSYLETGQDTHSLLPSLTKIAGRHTIKAGGDLRLRRNNLFLISNGGGTYSFNRPFTRGPNPNVFTANAGNGIASMLLGVGSGSINFLPGVSLQNYYFSGYFQDDIRVASKLTVNIGLRYETETPVTERRDQLGYFDFDFPSPLANPAFPNLTGALRFAGSDIGSRYAYNWDKNNFSPRIGLAWSALPKTVVRAGIGVFFGPLEINNNLNTYTPVNGIGYGATTPFVGSLDGLSPFRYLRDPYPDGFVSVTTNIQGARTLAGQAVTSWDYAARTPYTLQWNASVQRQIKSGLLLEGAYAASHGVKLARGYNRDALNPVYLSLGSGLQQLVDNPFYGQINVGALAQPRVTRQQLLLPYPQFNGVNIVNSSSASSTYHSLQAKAEKRLSHGVSFLVAYTFGKLISDSNNFLAGLGTQNNATGVQNWYNLRPERAVSEMDQSQSLMVNALWDLPFGQGRAFLSGANKVVTSVIGGWQFGTVVTYRAGIPLVMSAPVTGLGTRPNSTGQSAEITTSRSRHEAITRWFDTNQFLLPDPFTLGNVSRTLPDVRGPAIRNLDIILAKNFRVKERTEVQFRSEFFNVLNITNFWMPNTAYGSLQFGQINATQSSILPRVIQFALKVAF